MILLANITELWFLWLCPYFGTIDPENQRPPPNQPTDKALMERDVKAVGQFLS